jgi:glycosyltransferase involved in cell wall biosynthesis
MEALYRRHDILLFPTRYEAFGLVALEAMAAGLPVIGSSVVRSLIEGAGEVVVGDDAEAYAEALRALADPERRRLLGRVAMERARAFSWETSTASYLEVLNVVARDRGHQHRHQGRRM